MKNYILLFLAIILWSTTLSAATIELSAGVWKTATTGGGKTGTGGDFSIAANNTYNINGNVSIEGQITIKSGYTVKIQGKEQAGSSETYYRIWNKIPTYDSSKAKKSMFVVEKGATLIIDKVNINGNAHLSWNSTNKTLYYDKIDDDANDGKGEGARVLYNGCLVVYGNLTMTNCIIHDILTYCDPKNLDADRFS